MEVTALLQIPFNWLKSERSRTGPAETADDIEHEQLLEGKEIVFQSPEKPSWQRPLLIGLIIANGLLTLILILSNFFYIKQNLNCPDGPEPPISPPRQDRAVHYTNKGFKPDLLFQSESDEADEAWAAWFERYDKVVLISEERVAKLSLPETLDAWLDPGYKFYGLAYMHQMHCLDYVRKAFYPDKYFPNETRHEVNNHKNHCIDLIRQALLCHADVSPVRWWNDEYSFVDQKGVRHLTETYLSKSIYELRRDTELRWDYPARCHNLKALNDWVGERAMDIDRYLEELGPTPHRPHHAPS